MRSTLRLILSGMRVYGVAVTVVWAMCACSVLVILAIAVPGAWLRVAFGGGAAAELAFSVLTLRFLSRSSVKGRFDL